MKKSVNKTIIYQSRVLKFSFKIIIKKNIIKVLYALTSLRIKDEDLCQWDDLFCNFTQQYVKQETLNYILKIILSKSYDLSTCLKNPTQWLTRNTECPWGQVMSNRFSGTSLLTVIRTRGWESLLESPLRCPIMFIQEFYSNIHSIDTSIPWFATTFWGTCIVVTLNLISEVLHILRVAHLDCPGFERIRTVSKDELLSHFCEIPSIWGGKQNTPCSGFVKGLRFLNMVMTLLLLCLTIILSQSLMLVFFCLFLRTFL